MRCVMGVGGAFERKERETPKNAFLEECGFKGWKEKERKGKEHLYSTFIQHLVSKRSDMDHKVLLANYTMPAFPS